MTKQEKIKTGATGIEELEGKENELDAITNAFLENAEPDDIHTREIYQEKLQEFIKKAKIEEREYVESLHRVMATQYIDWHKDLEMSDERAGEIKKFGNAYKKLSEKYPEKRAEFIENLVWSAFPEYFCIERPWKKKKEKEDIDLSQFSPEADYAA